MKKKAGSSEHGKRAASRAKSMRDSQIDFSDIPELSDEQLATLRRIDRSAEDFDKTRRQVVAKKLHQLRRRSATLTENEIVAAVRSGRQRAGR